jgi:hypothetical protein
MSEKLTNTQLFQLITNTLGAEELTVQAQLGAKSYDVVSVSINDKESILVLELTKD